MSSEVDIPECEDTALAPELVATQQDCTAWSLDDDDEGDGLSRYDSWIPVILAWCVAAFIGLVVIAGAAAWVHYRAVSTAPVLQGISPSVQMSAQRENVPASTLSAVPDALAESQDTHFIALLKAQGLVPANDAAMINAAHTVCEYHRNGDKDTEIVKDLLRGGTDTAQQAFTLVNTAINVYCPQ